MLFIKSKLKELNLKNKKVFLRVDLNIDINNIDESFRLKAILPTVDYILEQNACIILATHIGRPNGYDPALSTKAITDWFKQHKYDAKHVVEIDKDVINVLYKPKSIIVLENLRFFDGEKNKSEDFAKLLKSFSDVYVTDAFGVLHRNETSVALLPDLFDKEHKTIGFLVEKELDQLNKLLSMPGQFLLILGGAKIKDKLILIKSLIEKIDSLFVLPAMVFTFLKAMGKNTGKSLIDEESVKEIKPIYELLLLNNKKIILPNDFLAIQDNKLEFLKIDDFKDNTFGVSVGPDSITIIEDEIKKADKIFYNGAMGLKEIPESLEFLKQIFESIASSNAFSVIAGGDSVQALYDFHFEDKIDFCSTGGGSALEYLSGKILPGLKPFMD